MPRSVDSVGAPPRRRPPEAAPPVPASGARRAYWRRIDPWRIAPTALAAVFAAVYLYFEPRSPDLAAHIFRAELFGREGFTIWNGQWYGGHHTPAYSILSPPLTWLLGPQPMGALSVLAATACFTELMRGAYGHVAARLGTVWFGAGAGIWLFTNRLPFLLGVAFGLAAALAVQRHRRLLAPLLALLAAISSPVAGLFVAMGGVAHALANTRLTRFARRGAPTDPSTEPGSSRPHSGHDLPTSSQPLAGHAEHTAPGSSRPHSGRELPTSGGGAVGVAGTGTARDARRDGLVLAAAAFVPPVLLSLAFPEGGWAPFPFSAYLPIPLFALACLLLVGRGQGTLRWMAVLYATGSTAALVLHTAMGGNAVRLGALLGGPVLACALWPRLGRRPLVPTVALLGALAFWQFSPAVRDIYKAIDDPVAKASYFDPLREYLALEPGQWRVEIPFTFGHWEGAEVASEAPLARGWLRQLDTGRHPIFYGGQLNELTYASWLSENAVRFVALPDAKPDASSYRERALIERGLPYLRLRKQFDHWRIYEVTLPAPFVLDEGGADVALEQLGSDRALLRVRRPGSAIVRVRWTPYWLAKGACVERAGEWTRVIAERTGFVELVTRFGPERIVQRGRRCNDA